MSQPTRFALNAVAAATLAALAPNLAQAQAAAQPAQPAALEEVVVTVQKTRENPQKVPLSITAISGSTLSEGGVRNMNDLQGKVTGLNIIQQGPGAAVQIRGVGSNPGGGNVDPSVAFSLDGVYQSRSSSAFGTMYDMERVEVLKGPQGTLYGRNATVGALNVIANRPKKVNESQWEFELGNYDLARGLGVVNAVVNDVVSVRAAGQIVKRKGYLSDGYNDADDQAGRVKLLIEPSKDLTVMVTADAHHKGGNGEGNVYTGSLGNFNANGSPYIPAPGSSWNNTSTQTHTPARDDTGDAWNNGASFTSGGHAERPNEGLSIKNYGLSTEINYNLGGATLTVLPAWRASYVLNQSYTGGNLVVPAYSLVDQSQRSLEVRLASDGAGPLKWIGGFFYINEDAPTVLISRNAAANTSSYTDINSVKAKSSALFGQATYTLLPTTRATAGLRFTQDDKRQDGSLYTKNVYATDRSGTTTVGPLAVNARYSDSALNYKLGIDHDLAKNVMVYGSFSTGYKAGGLNMMPSSSASGARYQFRPETLTALATGFKSRLFGNSLQLNGEAFYWRYKDQQVAVIDQVDSATAVQGAPFAGIVFLNNPGTSKIFGFDLDATWRATAQDRITASLAYLHARNGTFQVNATKQTITVGFNSQTNTPIQIQVPLEAYTDVSGKVMPFSPTWSMNLGYSHTFHMTSGGAVVASIDGHGESASYVNYHLFSPERQGAYFRGNLALSYNSPDSNYTLTGYVRNFTNVAVLTRGGVSGGTNTVPAGHYANIMPPRTFGVVVGMKF